MAYPPTENSAPPPHLLGVLRSLWRWRKPILLFTGAGAVLAAIVSLLLPVYYTGYTSFVALSPEQISIESTFGTTSQRIPVYGTGDDIDRLLSVAESADVQQYLVRAFDLYAAYDIDSTNRKAPLRVIEELQSRYAIERNPRDVIELTVEDKDPERAAAMARAARERINEVNLALIRSAHRRNANGLQQDVSEGERRLTQLNLRLAALRDTSGVYNTESQSEILASTASVLDQQIARTRARLDAYRTRGPRDSINRLSVDLAGLESSRESLNAQLDRLNRSIGDIENMEEERLITNESLSESRTRLNQYQTILDGDRRTLEVIEEAEVPIVKSYPIRWLIVVASTILSFLLAIMGALLIDTGRRYDWSRITH